MAKFYAKEEDFKEVLKSGETPDKMIYKESVEGETRAVNESTLTIDFVISSSNIDRMHDSIDQNGWDLKAFKKNPVVLWAHDQSQPPVAKAIPRSIKIDGKKLLATAQFMPADVSEFSYMIFQMYKLGFMNATSVGFRPLEWSFAEDDKRPYGVNFTKQELLEFSCVPVPANSDALMGAKSMGVNTRPLKTWVENALDNWKDEGDLLVPKSNLEILYKSLSARTKLLKPLEDIMTEKTETVEETVNKEANAETVEKTEVENTSVGNAVTKDAEGSGAAAAAKHNPELVAAYKEFTAVHKAAQSLHRSAAALHKSAMGSFCKAFDPNNDADGDGTDYDPNDKALNELVEKYLETMKTKTTTEVVVKAEVDTSKIEGLTELVELVKSLQTQVADLTALVKPKTAEVTETKTETVVDATVENKSDEITFSFEDSVDNEMESVSFEEVKSLLASINFDEMIETRLKAKLGSKV